MKKYLIIAFMLATPAFASDWVQTGETNNFKHYLDKDSVRVKSFDGYGKGKYVSAWVRYDYKTVQNVDGITYWESKALRHYDCTQQKWDLSRLASYDKQGNNVGSATKPISFYSSQNWQDVIPDSVVEAEFTMACQLAGLN